MDHDSFNFLLIADQSGSMHSTKALSLKYAIERFVYGLAPFSSAFRLSVQLLALGQTYNEDVRATPPSDFSFKDFTPGGSTPLTETMGAIADHAQNGTVLVLFSDGNYNDSLFLHISHKNFYKYAVAIGYDANLHMLAKFSGAEKCFHPVDADRLGIYILNDVIGAMDHERIPG